MIGDRIIIQPKDYIIADKILKKFLVKFKSSKKRILAIGGISGTSKTEIATVIQEKLYTKNAIRSKIIHIDDYYFTNWNTRNKIRKQNNIIGKEEINWNKLNKVLQSFKNNKKKLYVQRIHRWLNAIEHSISPNNCIDVIILEGLYALYAKYFDFRVYIDASISDTYAFRKLRGKENPDNKFRQLVVEKESQCVYQSKKSANLIIDWREDVV